MSKRTNMLKSRLTKAIGIILTTLAIPSMSFADCTKLVDKHLEYYAGVKDHLDSSPTFDPGIKKLPYDVKILSNNPIKYLLFSRNISFFYPNIASSSRDFLFQDGYISAICIVETPNEKKWVVWQGYSRLWFYPEFENPQQ